MSSTLREHFPCFKAPNQMASITYFDNAATTQKPQKMLQAIQDYYLNHNSNVHRSNYRCAALTTDMFEATRARVQTLINAADKRQVIFTKGTTESINMVASGLAQSHFKAGKRILISATEHHANLVPWQQVAKRHHMLLDVIPVDDRGVWDLSAGLALLSKDTVLVAIGHVSNALGNINPIETVIQNAKQLGALTLIDGAQAIAHLPVDVQALQCDFYAFSAHKAYGPTGVGVLYGKYNMLDQMDVYQTGGEMVSSVTLDHTVFQPLPYRFEAGTPNIEGVIAFDHSLQFLLQYSQQIAQQESILTSLLRDSLAKIDGLSIWGDADNHIATVSFSVAGCHPGDIGTMLDQQGFAVRVGSHCAMPLMAFLQVDGTVRVSLACYNTKQEVLRFIAALKQVIAILLNDQTDEQLTRAQLPTDCQIGPLAQKVKASRGWDSKYRHIMLAGKAQPRCADDLIDKQNLVSGCESQVWLKAQLSDKGTVLFQSYSDSKIVRGLLAIIIEPIQGADASLVKTFNFQQYMQELGLQKHLSESRANGVASVIDRIRTEADALTSSTHLQATRTTMGKL